MEQEPISAPVEPPRGIYPGRVDEKGRLKLPAAFQQYLESMGEKKVFVTTLDVRIVRIYPISRWKENEIFFEAKNDDPAAAEDLAFIANDFGADSELDGQGRVLIPPQLRRTLGIENQPVWLDAYKGRINVYGKEIYDERRRRAMEGLQDKLRNLEKAGLK